MYTSSHIRRFINNLSTDKIFATRELLTFGKRSAVDRCLSRLVKRGEIIRLARGIFKKFDISLLPSLFDIAVHKAKVFGRQIITYHYDAAKVLNLINDNCNPTPAFSISGHSSRFSTDKDIIKLHGVSARKISLGDDKVGLAMRALWHLGKLQCNRETIMIATVNFTRQQRHDMRQKVHLMPAWLSDLLFC